MPLPLGGSVSYRQLGLGHRACRGAAAMQCVEQLQPNGMCRCGRLAGRQAQRRGRCLLPKERGMDESSLLPLLPNYSAPGGPDGGQLIVHILVACTVEDLLRTRAQECVGERNG